MSHHLLILAMARARNGTPQLTCSAPLSGLPRLILVRQNSYGTGTCVQDPCELSADLVLYRLTRKSNQAVPTIGCIHQIHRRLRLSRDTCMS